VREPLAASVYYTKEAHSSSTTGPHCASVGKRIIMTSAECMVAGQALGFKKGPIGSWKGSPPGCHFFKNNKNVNFNKNFASTGVNGNDYLICQAKQESEVISCEKTPVPYIGGERMVALSFELTNPADQESPASEKVTKYGKNLKIVKSGGVAGGAYATGFALSKSWGPTVPTSKGGVSGGPARATDFLHYTHGDYSVNTAKEHRTFIAWYKGKQTIDQKKIP